MITLSIKMTISLIRAAHFKLAEGDSNYAQALYRVVRRADDGKIMATPRDKDEVAVVNWVKMNGPPTQHCRYQGRPSIYALAFDSEVTLAEALREVDIMKWRIITMDVMSNFGALSNTFVQDHWAWSQKFQDMTQKLREIWTDGSTLYLWPTDPRRDGLEVILRLCGYVMVMRTVRTTPDARHLAASLAYDLVEEGPEPPIDRKDIVPLVAQYVSQCQS